MKKTRLSEKLILYFVLLGLGAILIIGAVSFFSTRSALMDRTFDQLTSLRTVKKNQVEQFYRDRSREALLLAGSIKRPSLVGEPACRTGTGSDVGSNLPSMVGEGSYFTACSILKNNGVIISGNEDKSSSRGMPALTARLMREIRIFLQDNQVYTSDLFRDEKTGNPCQVMATGLNRQDSESGHSDILLLAVSVPAINAIMLNNNPASGLGMSGETYLVGPDLLMRSTSRFQPRSVLETMVKTPPAIHAVSGQSGTMTTGDYRGIAVLSSYEKMEIPGLRWAILAEIDVREAMIPIYETRTRIMLLSMIILVVFFGFVMFIARRITRPLIRLRDATVNLAGGRYAPDLPVTTGDEIGALTESFNTMARQIREKTTELQQERFGRMRSVIDGEEMERQRLSRELHDGIGQQLIAITLRLESLLYQDRKDILVSIRELKKYFDQIIDEVRRISNNLMPSVLEAFGLAIAFRNLFSETEEHSGLRIHFEARGDFDDLDKKIKTYTYRLTQEALSNIVKHAAAREVWVTLLRVNDNLTLVIRDDGKGFNPATAGKEGGNGIHNMRERASLLQGEIVIRSAPGKGTSINVNIPIFANHVNNQDFPRG